MANGRVVGQLSPTATYEVALATQANQGLVPSWRATSVMMLRIRAWRASIMVLRSASATRHDPDR